MARSWRGTSNYAQRPAAAPFLCMEPRHSFWEDDSSPIKLQRGDSATQKVPPLWLIFKSNHGDGGDWSLAPQDPSHHWKPIHAIAKDDSWISKLENMSEVCTVHKQNGLRYKNQITFSLMVPTY